MFRLKDAEIIAAGRTRDVYRHPDDASLLIKVIRPSAIAGRAMVAARPGTSSSAAATAHLIAYLREVREQIAVHATGEPHPTFLQKIVGFVDTDMGMGLVVEAVRAADGTSAPTVAELAGQGRARPGAPRGPRPVSRRNGEFAGDRRRSQSIQRRLWTRAPTGSITSF